MTRGELIREIALEYAEHEHEHAARVAAGARLAPLDAGFAFGVGRRAVARGDYKVGRSAVYIDWAPHARDARKLLPWARRALALHEEGSK